MYCDYIQNTELIIQNYTELVQSDSPNYYTDPALPGNHHCSLTPCINKRQRTCQRNNCMPLSTLWRRTVIIEQMPYISAMFLKTSQTGKNTPSKTIAWQIGNPRVTKRQITTHKKNAHLEVVSPFVGTSCSKTASVRLYRQVQKGCRLSPKHDLNAVSSQLAAPTMNIFDQRKTDVILQAYTPTSCGYTFVLSNRVTNNHKSVTISRQGCVPLTYIPGKWPVGVLAI